jgi:CubicO group peptidase (beta-lactamase class C family)
VLLLAPLQFASAQMAPNPAVDRIFARWDSATSPGCTVGVVRDGRMVYARGYGMANLDYDIPNAPVMAYYAGSVSKQFTAAAIALLATQGRLSLDDDVRTYVPELPDYGTPITVRQLVHHTSGVRDIYELMRLAGIRSEDVFSDEDALALIARQTALNFAPGSEYLYSNSGYFLLAQIVKRVSGMSLREYADANIFRPLGMTRTHFHDDPGHVMKQRAMSYQPDGAGSVAISYLQNFDKTGAGGLYTTIGDLAKWDENFYTRQVGGDALHALLHTRGVLTGGDTIPYAFGNNVTTHRGLRTVEHGGTYMGYKAYFLRFPDQRFSVVELCNLGSIDPGPLAYAVAEVYLGDRLAAVTTSAPRARGGASRPTTTETPDAASLAAYAGEYHAGELDVTYRVTVAPNGLHVRAGRVTLPLAVPAGGDTFRAGSITLRFERSSGGVTGFTAGSGRVRDVRFERK